MQPLQIPSQVLCFVSIDQLKPMFDELRAEMRRENEFPEIMTLTQVCQYLQLSAPSVRKAIKEDDLPVVKTFGEKAPRFVKREIDAWLSGQIQK
jgi:excisionase family DNA binding protein